MAGARDWVREHFGEQTARGIEKVAAAFFGDDTFVKCSRCGADVPANVVADFGWCCPVCNEASNKLTTDALLAQREAAQAKGEEAKKEVEELERLITARNNQR